MRFASGLALIMLLGSACGPSPSPVTNPRSLWLDFAQREVDLVLTDHEPPPF